VFGVEPCELSVLHFLAYVKSAGGLDNLIQIPKAFQDVCCRVVCVNVRHIVSLTSWGDDVGYHCGRFSAAVGQATRGNRELRGNVPFSGDYH